jgi:tRNA dimethylallyltransferase
VLHQRIEQRFDAMMAEGFLEEARRLFERGDLHRDLPSMRCVGYRQAWGYLAGEYGLEEMRRRAIAATRQLAKRQLTWLRQERGALWYDPTEEGAQRTVFEKVRKFLE